MHSEGAGFGRDWYAERSLVWLVRAVELELREPVAYGETLRVSTEVVGFRRVWARRKSEFQTIQAGTPAAVATIDWVLLGPRGPVSVPVEIAEVFESRPGTFTPMRLRLPPPRTAPRTARLRVRRQDVDPMGHVNNAAYLDYLEEAVGSAGGEEILGKHPRRYRVEYLDSAEPEALLGSDVWATESGWACSMATVEQAGGADLHVARATLESDQPANSAS